MMTDDAHPISRWKNALLAVAVWIAFFAALELVLWAIGVESVIEREDPTRGFSGQVSVFERDGERYRTRAFDTQYRTFNPQSFAVDKPEGGLRLFSIGGSSAYGYPWGAETAFTGLLGDVIAAAEPDRTIETINAAGISYAIQRLRFVAHEIGGYQPDVLIVYSGHNEFVERVFRRDVDAGTGPLAALRHALSYSRLYGGLQSLLGRAGPARVDEAQRLDPFVRRTETVVFSEAEKAVVAAEFRETLRRIVREAKTDGTRVVLSTVPANLRDWRPERSQLPPELDEAATRTWRAAFEAGKRALAAGDPARAEAAFTRALGVAPQHAETHFLRGRAQEGLEQWDAARASYRLACDYDAAPARRTSAINDAVREVAAEEGVVLVDMDRIFEEHSPHGLVGFDLVEDYVHPTPEGHRLIAWELWQRMQRENWLPSAPEPQRVLFERVVARRPPTSDERNVIWLYNQAAILKRQGSLTEAMAKYRSALEIEPDFGPAHDGLGVTLESLGRSAEAVVHLRRAVELDPHSAQAHTNLGASLGSLGQVEEAVRHFRRSLELEPDYSFAHLNLGTAQMARGEVRPAAASFRRALELNPGLAGAANNLAWLLATASDPAVRDGEEALRLARSAAEMTDHTDPGVLDTLAAAYAEQGRFEDAVRTAKQALEQVGPGPSPLGREIRMRLALFESGRPFRQ